MKKTLWTTLFLVACGDSGKDTGPGDTSRDTGDPPPACDGGPYEATECGLHEDLPSDWNYRRLQNVDEGVDVIVVREPTGAGPGETTQYDLRGFGLVKDGCLTCVSDESVLSYATGHHNWYDDADALIDGVTHRAHMQYQPEDPDDYMSEWVWSYDLSGLDPTDSEVLWGPVSLDLTEGPIW